MSTFDRLEVAYHESGHALLSVLSGQKLKWVTTRPNKKYEGYCRSEDSLDAFRASEDPLTWSIRTSVAGAISLMIGMHEGWSPPLGWRPSSAQGAGQDMKDVKELMKRLGCQREPVRRQLGSEPDGKISSTLPFDLDAVIADTYAILTQPRHRRALDVLAHILVARVALKGTTVEMIIRDTMEFGPQEGCVLVLNVPLDLRIWKDMVALGASYAEKEGGWWVPQSAYSRAADIRDKALNIRAMQEADKHMDWSRLEEYAPRY